MLTDNTLITRIVRDCRQFEFEYSQRRNASLGPPATYESVIAELDGIHQYRKDVVGSIADLRKSQLDTPTDPHGCEDENKPNAAEEGKPGANEESMSDF